MRTISFILALAIAFTISFIIAYSIATPANSAQGTWVDGGHWKIQGDSSYQVCKLFVEYEDNQVIGVLAGEIEDGPAMLFYGRNIGPLVEEGAVVEASLVFSNDAYHQIVAEVVGPKTIIAKVPVRAVENFANATSMQVRVRSVLIGSYALTGTRNMVEELVRCVDAMRGDPT